MGDRDQARSLTALLSTVAQAPAGQDWYRFQVTSAIVGFARMQMRDWPWAVTAFVALGLANRIRRKWEHTAPKTWPPPETFQQLRRNTHETLPGARISRLLLGRYLIVWRAPG